MRKPKHSSKTALQFLAACPPAKVHTGNKRSMVRLSNFQLCANGTWNVGSSESNGRITISLFRRTPNGSFFAHPVFDGLEVPNHETKDRILFLHGFLVEHKGGFCLRHRRQHKWCYTRLSGGNCLVYEGSDSAHDTWDGEDWTRSKVTCACGTAWFQQNYLLQDPAYDAARVRQCWECRWAEDKQEVA